MAERKRRLVREELGEVALRLLAAQGFECTTIDQIVEAAGVSRRTFFRYFKSKEDVIIEFLGDLAGRIGRDLAARPAQEPPLTALRLALRAATGTIGEHRRKSVALTKLIMGSPALRGRYFDRQADLQRALAAVLAERAGAGAPDLRTELTAAMGVKAFDLALERWAAADGAEDFGGILDEVFDALPL